MKIDDIRLITSNLEPPLFLQAFLACFSFFSASLMASCLASSFPSITSIVLSNVFGTARCAKIGLGINSEKIIEFLPRSGSFKLRENRIPYLMVTEHGHGPVCPVVGQHLGRRVVLLVRQLVQLALEGDGDIRFLPKFSHRSPELPGGCGRRCKS